MTHFDKSVRVEWHYNKVHHRKGPMDGADGKIKSGFQVGEIKQYYNKHSGRIFSGGFKGVLSNQSTFLKIMRQSSHGLSTSLHTFRELMIHIM